MKRSRLMVLFALVLIIIMACDSGLSTTTYPAWSGGVELEVTGTTTEVSITYQNGSGGTSQVASTKLPWKYLYYGYPSEFYYLSAQNQKVSGSVIVTIYKTDKNSVKHIYNSSTSTGAYVIATTSGSL